LDFFIVKRICVCKILAIMELSQPEQALTAGALGASLITEAAQTGLAMNDQMSLLSY
jgi:hypothetical protein